MTKLRAESVDGIPVICTECGRVLTKETVEDAKKVKEGHNDRMHDGDNVAYVVEDECDIDTSEVPNGERDSFIKEIIALVE